MKGVIVCEESQAVTMEFRNKGHVFFSCDTQYCSGSIPEYHLKYDAIDLLYLYRGFDFIGAHPPCTYLCNSGVRWLYNKDGSKNIKRWIDLEKGIEFFNEIKSYIKKGYLENPIPHKYARDGFYSIISGKFIEGIGKYTQKIQPYEYGHGETKATCLWLIDLPKLKPTNIVPGREQKIWKMPPSLARSKLRSKTYSGIAKAMAEQWTK